MTDNVPDRDSLPSTRTLIRSAVIAAAVATVILVTAVLPAEYGIDPTGAGRVLGLTKMGEIKASLAAETGQVPVVAPAPGPEPVAPAAGTAPPGTPVPTSPTLPAAATTRTAVTRVTLKPGEGKEIKLTMRKDARVAFSWSTDTGVVNYDLHSDNPTSGAYHGYGKGVGVGGHDGTLVAAFDGSHGWFWRNRTRTDVTVTLETNGDYQDVKAMP